ncbi:MAG: hypothetical protein HY587_03170 [Candidatus Omnitrophica bacterium]|nr:hypothetical protein [Candidatus Omnitrophota bacterium]
MGKTVALIVAVLLVLVLGAALFAVQTRFQRELSGLQQLLEKQEGNLGILRADNAYLKSQTTEISVLEEELAGKRTEIDALKKKGEEQQEMILSLEERLNELGVLREQLDRLEAENERLRLEAGKKALEGLGAKSTEVPFDKAPAGETGESVTGEAGTGGGSGEGDEWSQTDESGDELLEFPDMPNDQEESGTPP